MGTSGVRWRVDPVDALHAEARTTGARLNKIERGKNYQNVPYQRHGDTFDEDLTR